MQWLTIGQMAKLNQVSEQTLRLYDKKGLLSPCKRGDDNQYRYYDIKQSAILDMIQYMKSLGMNLRDIKTQLDNKTWTIWSMCFTRSSSRFRSRLRP